MSRRPYPPESLQADADNALAVILRPASELEEWVNTELLNENGHLYNADHEHLVGADIAYLWASHSFVKKGKGVAGQCEQLMFRVGGWQKARQEQQFNDWFGRVPKFVITLAADYCMAASDAQFCALVEHELYHIGQELDEYGAPKFTQEGEPRLTMASHDVEEFIGVVKRYGASDSVAELVEAANKPRTMPALNIAASCGTCLKAVA